MMTQGFVVVGGGFLDFCFLFLEKKNKAALATGILTYIRRRLVNTYIVLALKNFDLFSSKENLLF